MSSNQLKKYSLVSALLGVFLLLLIKDNLTITNSNINELNISKLDQKVKTTGIIKQIYKNENNYFVIIENNQQIGVSIFTKEDLNLKQNQELEVEGVLTEFNNRLTIQANIIRY